MGMDCLFVYGKPDEIGVLKLPAGHCQIIFKQWVYKIAVRF
jgi:hypothetical protein